MKKADKQKIMEQIGADAYTFHKDGTITAKWTYYYRFGNTPSKYAEKVGAAIQNCEIIDTGDHFHGFVGGAKTGGSQDSYMWVRFQVAI